MNNRSRGKLCKVWHCPFVVRTLVQSCASKTTLVIEAIEDLRLANASSLWRADKDYEDDRLQDGEYECSE